MVTAKLTPDVDLANDTWRRMTELFLSRKHQVMETAAAHNLNPGAMNALEGIQPGFVRQPATGRSFAVSALGIAVVLLAAGGVVFASTAPDGIEQLAMQAGLRKPLAGYGGGAGVAGVALLYLVCLAAGRVLRKRSA